MPNQSQHRKKAENNRKFLDTISIDDYPDWAVVVAVYTAVHRVEEVRAAAGDGDSTGHEDRLAYIQARHPKVHTAYHILQNAAWLARYESNSAFFKQFQPDIVKERIVDKFLVEVEHYATDFVKRHTKSA